MTLELDQVTMQRLGHLVADQVARHLATLREQRVHKVLPRREAEPLIHTPPPAEGREVEALLEFLTDKVFAYHVPEPHPGFLGYVQSCSTFPAVLGDWLATGYNFFGGAWGVASGPAQLELTVLDWFREWVGMPQGTSGLLTSGGSTANLMALVAARHAAVGDDSALLPRLTVYASDQAHSSLIRAAWIAGIPRANVRILPSDDQFRLRPDLLREAVAADGAAGFHPLMVLATAGTTNTGATDPLPELAAWCNAQRLWLHIDAAYGGFAALAPRGRAALEGLGLADSITLDPHKWLYVPFECGSLLVREPRRLLDAFHILPDYLRDLDPQAGEVNFADRGEQLSRMSRAVKVWLGVCAYGTRRLAQEVEGGIRRAEMVEALARKSPRLEVLSSARLGVCCFRLHPKGLNDPDELDRINLQALERVHAGGRFFLSTTRLRGALALRVCCCGWRTTDADIAALMQAIEAAL